MSSIKNGTLWTDTSGKPTHAHGGGMLRVGEYVYWFGENREGRRRVSCYRSTNLTDWEFRGDVLTLDSPFQPVDTRTGPELVTDKETERGANIERPKVVYNELTGRFVMWMHWENGKDYSAARCAVASSDAVDGEYVYHGSFNPIGHMSRDCTLFVDDDGTAYFISAARENADLLVYRLSDDYLAIDEQVKTLWPGQYREAPVLMKRNGVYFLVTSGCTGWEPNQGKYAYSDSIIGRWSSLYDFGNPTTYDTQPTYILPIHGREVTTYLYIGDRWDPTDYHSSSYALLPLAFPDEKTIQLDWSDSVRLDLDSGRVQTNRAQSGLWRIRNGSHRYLASPAKGTSRIAAQKLSYASRDQQWIFERTTDGYVRIKNNGCGRYLESEDTGKVDLGVEVSLQESSERQSQQWHIIPQSRPGWCSIQNCANGRLLTLNREFDGALHLEEQNSDRNGQTFLLTEQYGEF